MSASHILSQLGVLFMRALAHLPLPWLRALGAMLGAVLYVLAKERRQVVRTNLMLCFSEHSVQEIRRQSREIFKNFGISFIDRSWLWHAPRAVVCKRLKLAGDVQALQTEPHVVVFAPHFFGLDAGGTAIMAHGLRPLCSIYTPQSNAVVDAWIRQGRSRFDEPVLLSRYDSPREIARQVRSGRLLYLLPDMDFGSAGAEFVPFFGVPAATLTSLSRFSKLAQARVQSLVSRITPEGYEVSISVPWENFPTTEVKVDTERMNRELEALISPSPAQYYWVHKRFKTRPPGEKALY